MEKKDHETSWNKSMYFGAYKNWRTFFFVFIIHHDDQYVDM